MYRDPISTSYSSTSYSRNSDEDLNGLRTIVYVVVLVVELLGAAIIYGFIKCCCPTSLRKVRTGLVLSDDPRSTIPSVQPTVIQSVTPMEAMGVSGCQRLPPPPPQYSESQSEDSAMAVDYGRPISRV